MATTAPESTTPKVKSIQDLRTPIFFSTVDEASAYLNKIASPTLGEAPNEIPNPDYCADFATAPLILNGMDEHGNFLSDVYTADTRVAFHVLTNRGKSTQDAQGKEVKAPATVRAVIVTPVPTLEAIANDKTGAEWLAQTLNTRIVKVLSDPIRNADNVTLAAKDMPLTLADFVTTSRESSSIMEAFDKLFRPILDLFKDKSPAFARARLNKAEFKKALESKEYALAVYPTLEDRGDKPSFFVMAATFAVSECAKQGLDSTVWTTWLKERDETKASDKVDDADDENGLDDLDSLEGLTLAPAPTETTPAPAATEEAPNEQIPAPTPAA